MELMQRLTLFQGLETLSRTGNERSTAGRYVSGIAILQPSNRTNDVGAVREFFLLQGAPKDLIEDFLTDWLGPEGLWPNSPTNRAGVVRCALHCIATKYLSDPKPCDFFWVTAELHNRRSDWQVTITDWERRLTVIFHTPPPCRSTKCVDPNAKRRFIRYEDREARVLNYGKLA